MPAEMYLLAGGIGFIFGSLVAFVNMCITRRGLQKNSANARDGGQPAADACEHRSPGGGIFYPEAAPLTVLRYYHRARPWACRWWGYC